MDQYSAAEDTSRPALPEDLSRRVSETGRFLDAHPAAGSGRLPVWVAAACLGAGVLSAGVLLAPGCGGEQKEGEIPRPPAGLETALVKPDAAVMDPAVMEPAVMEPELESEDPMDPLPGQLDPPPGSMAPIPPPTRGADDSGRQDPFALTGPADGRPKEWKMPSGPVGAYGAPPMSALVSGRQPRVVGPDLKTVTGGLDSAEVKAVIRAHRNEVHHCYGKGLMQDGTLQGELRVRFRVNEAGRATDCTVEQHLKVHEVGNCVCTRLATWRFPVPEKPPGVVSVSWTLSAPEPENDLTR